MTLSINSGVHYEAELVVFTLGAGLVWFAAYRLVSRWSGRA